MASEAGLLLALTDSQAGGTIDVIVSLSVTRQSVRHYREPLARWLEIASACVIRPADVYVVTINWICRRALRIKALVKLTVRICPAANRIVCEPSTVIRVRR